MAAEWGYIQTVYGVVRDLHGGAALAWLVQGATTAGAAIIVWLVWRSAVRYPVEGGDAGGGSTHHYTLRLCL
jgi:hypothetical protein